MGQRNHLLSQEGPRPARKQLIEIVNDNNSTVLNSNHVISAKEPPQSVPSAKEDPAGLRNQPITEFSTKPRKVDTDNNSIQKYDLLSQVQMDNRPPNSNSHLSPQPQIIIEEKIVTQETTNKKEILAEGPGYSKDLAQELNDAALSDYSPRQVQKGPGDKQFSSRQRDSLSTERNQISK